MPSTINRHNARKGAPLLMLALSASVAAFCAAPVLAHDLSPEISSRIWNEGDMEVAAVSLNGKDVATFRASSSSGDAAEEAEDLAAHLTELVADKNFDPSQLLPAHDGDKAVIKLAGNSAVTFRTLDAKQKDKENSGLDASLKIVNALRSEYNAQPLPSNFPDLADKGSLASASGAFSGPASWYGPNFHGKKTSDGHRFDQEGMTAAHRSLPFGTRLLVLNRRTGDSCVVEVNDRGPFIGDRVLDLSRGAARRLNMLGSGVCMVDCLIIGNGN